MKIKNRTILRKIQYLALCFLGILCLNSIHVFAETTSDYKSGTGAGFYGEYIYPEESDKDNGIENDHNDSSSPEKEKSVVSDGSSKLFPKTGEEKKYGLFFLGCSIVITSSLLLLRRKKLINKGVKR